MATYSNVKNKRGQNTSPYCSCGVIQVSKRWTLGWHLAKNHVHMESLQHNTAACIYILPDVNMCRWPRRKRHAESCLGKVILNSRAHQKYENVKGFQHRGEVLTLLHSCWSCMLTWLRAEEFKHGQFWMHFWMSGSQLQALLQMLHLIWEDRAATCPTDQWYHMKRWSQYTFKQTL